MQKPKGLIRTLAEACLNQVRAVSSPMIKMEAEKVAHLSLRNGAVRHGMAEYVTSASPHPKVAELGRAFEEMQEHALFKRFRRGQIHLYVDKEAEKAAEVLSESQQAGWLITITRVLNAQLRNSPAVRGIKSIVFPVRAVEALTEAEARAALGHEMGHILRVNGHPRRFFRGDLRVTRASEKMADDIGVILSGEPEATKSGLDKISALIRADIEALPAEGFWARRFKHKAERQANSSLGNRLYPVAAERFRRIDAIAERIATPEGRSLVEEELASRLEAQHRRLFAHQLKRDLDKHPFTR